MASATMCTLEEPILEINIVKSAYYIENINQIPLVVASVVMPINQA